MHMDQYICIPVAGADIQHTAQVTDLSAAQGNRAGAA